MCPLECQGCQFELSKPYKLPCLLHYVGPCCKDKILRAAPADRKCPLCDTNIDSDFAWTVDTVALENRYVLCNIVIFGWLSAS